MRKTNPILLVEDDPVDAETVKRALKKDLKVVNRLDITGNGEEALAYLRNPEHVQPCLILLDLRMPRMSGIEFLEVVKGDQALQRIPVVVLTSSDEEQDIVDSYNLSVAGYIVKPMNYNHFVDALRTVDVYWTLSELPPEE